MCEWQHMVFNGFLRVFGSNTFFLKKLLYFASNQIDTYIYLNVAHNKETKIYTKNSNC